MDFSEFVSNLKTAFQGKSEDVSINETEGKVQVLTNGFGLEIEEFQRENVADNQEIEPLIEEKIPVVRTYDKDDKKPPKIVRKDLTDQYVKQLADGNNQVKNRTEIARKRYLV